MIKVGPLARHRVSPLQFLMLLQLNRGAQYGYELFSTLREEFEGVWEIKTGTFYPAIRKLEDRGLVQTDKREEKDFYSLTGKGSQFLVQLGRRFKREYKFADRYFRALIKWMPPDLRERILKIMQSLSGENIDVYSNLQQFLEGSKNKGHKLEALASMRQILRNRLEIVEKIYEETMEES